MSEAHRLYEEQNKIVEFMNRFKDNAWFNYGKMRIYLRVGPQYYDGKIYRTLDIATVSIDDKRYRGKGLFKDFMKFLEAVIPEEIQIIHAENVITPAAESYFIKRGWIKRGFVNLPSYYNIRINAKPMEARSEAS